jgi:hypothetical protein
MSQNRFRPTMKTHNELLAQIQEKDLRIRELEIQLQTIERSRKRNRFISPRLIRLVKHANR